MNKKYRLKKDLPDSKPRDIYIWNESQKAYYKDGNFLGSFWTAEYVENNTDWFEEVVEPEPERIEAEFIEMRKNSFGFSVSIGFVNPISEDKLPIIKAAIEDVLNPEPKEKDTPSRDWEITAYSGNGIFNIGDSMFEYAERAYAENMGVCIHSVRRLSDNTVWTVGEETTSDTHYLYKPIKRFFEKEGVMYAQFDEGHGSNDGCLGLNALKKLPSKPQPLMPVIPENMCNICGGTMVYIRGKYPNTDKRKVCPTCATERLEQINEISSKEYRQTSQTIK